MFCPLPPFSPTKKKFSKTKYDVQYLRKFPIQLHLAGLGSLQNAETHTRTDRRTDGRTDGQTDEHESCNFFLGNTEL